MSTDHAPFRADHVGSFLRPPELKDARSKYVNKEIKLAELRKVEDRLIRDVVRMQEDVGLQSVTDGDFRRQSWSSDFLCSIGGVVQPGGQGRPQQLDVPVGQIVRDWQPPTPQILAKLSWPSNGIELKNFAFLRSITKRTPKVTIPSPSMLHFRGGRGAVDGSVYPRMEEFFDDLIGVYRAEVMNLASAGCQYLQMDDTNLAYLCDPRLRERVKGIGEDPDKLPLLYARLINAAIADRPADMKITVHLCRGNSLSRGHAEGGYEPVADAMFNALKVDGFFLEYDDARSGDFAPLRFVPKGNMRIVLGVITSKFGELESQDAIRRRLDEASRYLPLDQMCLSAQCGFASHTGGNMLTEEQQRAKLQLVVDVAREVWPDAGRA